ncbi:hypothetical protein BGAL_0527g00050 [Botrytis galanthina]|uniref:Major facilitator superfamily (MFS) profile domain-containing protein n=1 Tax=Botrytis galanthina TaxID=278940 RepID=A0A4S8QKA7_9HELO|nr:hypothetical protein BGAL_0527g00050 [Botrytis galanthina]
MAPKLQIVTVLMQAHLDIIEVVGWYGSVFLFVSSSFQSVWGEAYKSLPLRWALIASIVVWEIGILICGDARGDTTFIVGCALVNLAGSGIHSGSFTVIASIAVLDKRDAYTGLADVVWGSASMTGLWVAG